MIAKLPNAENYNSFAYHIPLLKEFIRPSDEKGSKPRKDGRDHTNPRTRAARRGTYMSDAVAGGRAGGHIKDLTSRSDGDQPKQGSFRNILGGSGSGPRARRSQSVKGT